MTTLRSILLLATVLFATLIIAAGCETAPPVQEMSDARQAIAVAREAGAEENAATALFEAEQYLQSAEEKLNDERYAEARRDALQAKSRALDARRESEESQQPER